MAEVRSAGLWIGKLLWDEIKHLAKVKDKVKLLQVELRMLAEYLENVSKNPLQVDHMQATLSEARNLAYDCEDVIETYILKVALHGDEDYEGFQCGSFRRCFNLARNAVPAHGIHSDIKKLSERFKAVKSSLNSYRLPFQPTNSEEVPFRPHQRKECVGLEKQLEELVGILKDSDDHRVIVISGMGGVGKSTLARELYHHPSLREGNNPFQAFGWATASRQLQPDKVLQTIMYLLVQEEDVKGRRKIDEDIRADLGHAALHKMMIEVKCLVVIDNIWEKNGWRQLQSAFPIGVETGSRLIITTRNEDELSDLDGHQVFHHPLKHLDDNNSWKLFEKITFHNAICTDSTKKELSWKMLQHCMGLPLAIEVLARLLQNKESVEDWENTEKDISEQIRRGEAVSPYEGVYDVLRVSYNHLPFCLKHCFLHFANYPEDFNFDAVKLYRLWVSEGIVSKENPSEMEEDIAERYLKELASRNMVQVVQRGSVSGRITIIRVHDLMRDVCIDIAKREGFLQHVTCHTSMLHEKNANHLFMTSLPQRDEKLRRLAVYVSRQQEPQTSAAVAASTSAAPCTSTSADVSRAPNLRTLLIFPVDKQRRPGDEEDCTRLMDTISQDFPLLRVLDCTALQIKGKLPEKVGDLIHLRYLGLWRTFINEVPSSIVKLQWLQTLMLETCDGVVVSLPNILWKLKQLRHLYLPDLVFSRAPDSDNPRYLVKGDGQLLLKGLCNLQTLFNIDLDRVSLEGLSNLDKLKTLAANCETKMEALHSFINCNSLKQVWLMLCCQVIDKEPKILSSWEALRVLVLYGREGAFYNLKTPLSSEILPKRLAQLSLLHLQLDADPLSGLGQLPNLQFLVLKMCDVGPMMACFAGGFPQLTQLSFSGLSKFDHWEVAEEALPKLKLLKIINCPLKKAPDAIPSSVTVLIE